jgi:hypothetical protein
MRACASFLVLALRMLGKGCSMGVPSRVDSTGSHAYNAGEHIAVSVVIPPHAAGDYSVFGLPCRGACC